MLGTAKYIQFSWLKNIFRFQFDIFSVPVVTNAGLTSLSKQRYVNKLSLLGIDDSCVFCPGMFTDGVKCNEATVPQLEDHNLDKYTDQLGTFGSVYQYVQSYQSV